MWTALAGCSRGLERGSPSCASASAVRPSSSARARSLCTSSTSRRAGSWQFGSIDPFFRLMTEGEHLRVCNEAHCHTEAIQGAMAVPQDRVTKRPVLDRARIRDDWVNDDENE